MVIYGYDLGTNYVQASVATGQSKQPILHTTSVTRRYVDVVVVGNDCSGCAKKKM